MHGRNSGSDAEAVSHDELSAVLEVLADRRRRLIVQYFHQHDDTCELSELAEYIAASTEVPPERLTADLYHTHIAKLEGIGAVEFDPRSRVIRYHGHPLVERFLDAIIDRE